jgi:hypothetical protein
MKSVPIIIALLFFTISLNAAPISNLSSSALMPGDSAIFNYDFVDPFGLPFYNLLLNAVVPGQSTIYTDTVNHVDISPYYPNTYQGAIHFNSPSGTIQYYGRVAADTLVATQSPKNTANQFPPASYLYAELATDAIGDTFSGTLGQYLDITGSAITYSDTKIYARLNNVGGGWPTHQGLTTYFLYGIVLVNPDTLSLRGTAMIYANVPVLFPAGLYSVNLADTSFSRIGSISSQTSGTNLHMSCNISDLLTDPNFPTWPPSSGHILVLGFTATMSLTGTPQFNDYSYPSSFTPTTGFLNVTGNNAPVLSNFALDLIPNLALTARCDYFDSDNNLPVTKQFFFDRGVYDMGSLDHSYSDTATFSHILSWPSDGLHYYFFRFSDGVSTFETPMDTIYVNPSGVEESSLPEKFTLYQNYPNPFNSNTIISFQLNAAGHVGLSVFDIQGNEVALLANDYMSAGPQKLSWSGKDNTGHPVSSGVYFYRLSIDGRSSAAKEMLLLK